ncbi:hornerin-like [Drosophila tropicalis]|uniref:hornerin-like n=1 Tax=Drosophila tropicalis TaxID=46794 RepID=UPI0035AC01BC
MPIVGQQYGNGFRPYSSFRVPRGSCLNHNGAETTKGTTTTSVAVGTADHPVSSNVSKRTMPGGGRSMNHSNKNNNNSSSNTTSSSSTASSTLSINQQGGRGGGTVGSSNFSRQQPWRSSYCSSNRHKLPGDQRQQQQQQPLQRLVVNNIVKPLTPKLIRRIESTCSSSAATRHGHGHGHGKAKAPAPPSATAAAPPTPNTARKQYQPLASGANISQKRTYQAGKSTKENCPTRLTQRSSKNYPAPLPPASAAAAAARKQNNDLTAKTTPLVQRRQLPATPKLNLKQRNGGGRAGGGGGGESSTGSSDSHDSPRLKKAYSNKFPQGLPFEEEFYGRNRSFSQSSSNYSFYSSVGAPIRDNDNDNVDDDDNDVEYDEFQRKPATDESLYVDFSKLVSQQQFVPASSWIRASPDIEDELLLRRKPPTSQLTQAQQRRKSSRSMHEYLYSDDNEKINQAKHRLSVVDEPEDGYYSYAAGTPEPPHGAATPPPPTQQQRTDIYVAAASWAPKPLYPDRVLLPSSTTDSNNNSKQQQQQRRRHEHLGSTTCEYK